MISFESENFDKSYFDLLSKIRKDGILRETRTGINAKSLFACSIRADLSSGFFPLITLKRVHFKSIVHELLWFLAGDTNIRYLNDHGVTIWDEWANRNGDLGPIYGKQWRTWGDGEQSTDQISELVKNLKENPYSRRHLVSAWNVEDIKMMQLPPCHYAFQSYVDDKLRLNTLVNMRSTDIFLGLPFNIASYALLNYLLSHVCGYTPGVVEIVMCDCHLYDTHFEATDMILNTRSPFEHSRPEILINKQKTNIFDFTYQDVTIKNYNSYPAIEVPVAV